MVSVLTLSALAVAGCQKSEPGKSSTQAAAKPVEPFKPLTAVAVDGGDVDAREAIFQVGPFTPAGPALPEGAVTVALSGEVPLLPQITRAPVLLVPDADTYLLQVAPLLEQLDDGRAAVWLKHPELDIAFAVMLRDEPAFQAWLEEAVPGKLRIIHRADGFELQTNMGKLPGADANGPTVPVRGGKMDLPTLRKGLTRIKSRFSEAPDFCIMPSFGMPMAEVARALAANWLTADAPIFGQACLVYPRPKRDGGRR